MGQISIPMLNKVGYSMYWNSMWDNKINYTRSLKEDIYLNKFIILIFEDCISSNVIKFYNKKYSDKVLNTYRIPVRSSNKKDFNRYLFKNNKVSFYPTKVWILKYQKWIILYLYIYLPAFNKLKIKKNIKNILLINNDSIFNLYNFYKKTNLKFLTSFNSFTNQNTKSIF